MYWPIVILGAVVSAVVFWKARQERQGNSAPLPDPLTTAERVQRNVAEALQDFRAPPWEGNGTPASDADRQRSKSASFMPGTLGLIHAMRWENDARFVGAQDEKYLLSEIVTAIANHLYHVLGDQGLKSQRWPVPDPILRAAREALPDFPGTYSAESLAYLLLRTGATDEFVLANLHPWERLAFTWKQEGLTGEKISGLLQAQRSLDRCRRRGSPSSTAGSRIRSPPYE